MDVEPCAFSLDKKHTSHVKKLRIVLYVAFSEKELCILFETDIACLTTLFSIASAQGTKAVPLSQF
jgi:hypothetical protein